MDKMENILKEMGKRIKKRRKEMNLSQEQLSELTDISVQTISTAELGKKALRPENIVKICFALNNTPNDIMLNKYTDQNLNKTEVELSQKDRERIEEIVNLYIAGIAERSN